ncbi:MAG: hypothetical protein HYS81_02155 [Candidatus Aenigmatarchaeota archaeon]|nr:MAG: hypothetical protein HYS81_02155 [Candidatus Aenigmarchaeota archaeon]
MKRLTDKAGRVNQDSLVLVHATKYFPGASEKDLFEGAKLAGRPGYLRPSVKYTQHGILPTFDFDSYFYKHPRAVLHFELNDLPKDMEMVGSIYNRSKRDWDKENFAVIIPHRHLAQSTDGFPEDPVPTSRQILQIHPHDTLVLGDVSLLHHTPYAPDPVVLAREGTEDDLEAYLKKYIEPEHLEFEKDGDSFVISERGGGKFTVKTLPKDVSLREATRETIRKMGYPVVEARGYARASPWVEVTKEGEIDRNNPKAFGKVPYKYGMYEDTDWFKLEFSASQLHRFKVGRSTYPQTPYNPLVVGKFVEYHKESIMGAVNSLIDQSRKSNAPFFAHYAGDVSKIALDELTAALSIERMNAEEFEASKRNKETRHREVVGGSLFQALQRRERDIEKQAKKTDDGGKIVFVDQLY